MPKTYKFIEYNQPYKYENIDIQSVNNMINILDNLNFRI